MTRRRADSVDVFYSMHQKMRTGGGDVVLDVIVHISIDEAGDRVHVDRVAVQSVIEHILGKPACCISPQRT